MSESRFPLLRRLSIVSLAAMVITATLLISLYREDQLTEHRAIAAEQNSKTLLYLMRVLKERNYIFDASRREVNAKALPAKADMDLLFLSALDAIHEKGVLKIKIYDLSGIAIYASFANEIGKTSMHPDFLFKALQGETVDYIEHRATFFGMGGEMHDIDIAVTYMPLVQAGKRIGAIEIYADVSQVFEHLRTNVIRIALIVFGAFSALYAALFFAVFRTDRAMAGWQKAVAESEKSLSEAEFIAGMGSYVLDIPSGSWKSSEALDRLLGIDETYEHSAAGWAALFHPDDQTKMLDHIRDEVIGQRKDCNRECRIIRHDDQSVRWIHGLGKLELDAEGRPWKLHGTIQDITERKRAEERLVDSENRFRSFMEQAPLSMQIFTPDGRTQRVNRAWENMWGATLADMAQYNVLQDQQLIDSGLMPYIEKAFAGEPTEIPATYYDIAANEKIHGPNKKFWVRAYMYPLKNAAGEIQEIALIHEDITERKKTEEALRIAAATFDSQEAILITDADSNIVRVNRAFTEVTGYRAEDVLGKNPRVMQSGRQDKSFYIEMWQRLLHDGVWSGEIWDKRKNGEIYPKWMSITAVKNERQETTHYVAIFSDITERKRIEEEIHNLAFYDVLTKLPNRRLFLDRFRSALNASARRNDFGAVLFIDLDRFKALNDALGHDYGDLLLIEVGGRIKSCIREMDTVSRFGGDEFVVLLEAVGDDKDEVTHKVALVAEKIREALALPYRLKEHEHHSSPSIGISLYHGNDEPTEVLLEYADMAMYQAKNSGRNAVRFFDPVMQHTVATHDALDNDLHHAIALRQLHLHYQIQVDNDNRPVGAEAFLRWIHPEHGIIMPGQLLPIAEESALIVDIGRWVLDTACRQLALWGRDARTQALTLTVNVSTKHFAQADFVGEVARTLKGHGADPHRLKLELSEKIVLTDTGNSIEKIQTLRSLGVRLSMDNFGTVYSSLSYLRQLSSDQLKIHREFVQGITLEGNDALLVKTVVNLAKSLDMNVFAEGVETEGQLTFLKDHDCNTYQGYLFGKPVAIEEFEALLGKLRE